MIMVYMGFKKLSAKVGSDALAAWIGRRKYGKSQFQKAAASGNSLMGKKSLLRRKEK